MQVSWSLPDSLTELWVSAKLPDKATKAMLQDLNLWKRLISGRKA